jgi:hypothetical protein
MQPVYVKITKYISANRLQKYEQVCGGNRQKVLKLYQTNIRLSQAFYPLLSLFEVVLRNAINEELTDCFSDPDWITNEQSGFMSSPSLLRYDFGKKKTVPNHFMKKKVSEVIKDLHGSHTQGKIIANLTFGFWTAFFDVPHYKILLGRPIKIFSRLPPSCNRSIVYQKLKRINDFRNRVYHNEAIIFTLDVSGNVVFDLQQSKEIYQDLNDLFQWLDLDYMAWTKRIDNIPLEIERANHVYENYPAIVYYINRIRIGLKHYKRKYL